MGTQPTAAQPHHAGLHPHHHAAGGMMPPINLAGQSLPVPQLPPPVLVGKNTDGRELCYCPSFGLYSRQSGLVFYGGMGNGLQPSFPSEQSLQVPGGTETVEASSANVSMGSVYPEVGGPGYAVPRVIAGAITGGWLGRRVFKSLRRALSPAMVSGSSPLATQSLTAASGASKKGFFGRLFSLGKKILTPLLKMIKPVLKLARPLARFALPLLGGGIVGGLVMAAMFAKELYDVYKNIQLYRHLRNPDSDEATQHVNAMETQCQADGFTPQRPLSVCAVGHSGGGASVIALANRSNRPDSQLSFRVKRIVLLDSPLTSAHLANIPEGVEVIHVRNKDDNLYHLATRLGPLVGLDVKRDPSGHLKATDKVLEQDAAYPLSSRFNPGSHLFERHCESLANWDHLLRQRFGETWFRENILQIQQTEPDIQATLKQAAKIKQQFYNQHGLPVAGGGGAVVTWAPPASQQYLAAGPLPRPAFLGVMGETPPTNTGSTTLAISVSTQGEAQGFFNRSEGSLSSFAVQMRRSGSPP
jgi:pimeloyl-ACP methyl ester carboxylesterase